MANVLSTSAIAKTLAKRAATVLQDALAPLGSFCTLLEIQQPDQPALDSEVALVTQAATTITDPTDNFEAGDCTIANRSMTHHLYLQPFGISNDDFNSGMRLGWLADVNARQFAAKIWDVTTSLLTVDNFGEPVATVSSAQFTAGDFDTLAAGISSPNRAVVLDKDYFVRVKPTWLPTSNCKVYEASRWSAAGGNIRGFVADPRAIVCRTGVSFLPKISVLERELIELPQLGVTAELLLWFNTATRSYRAGISCYFAAAVGDSGALKLLASA